ncbi:MAG: class I SAM-dependent methyltransferase [Geminicoccaceae bacterium]
MSARGGAGDAAQRMDQMYRWQRYIYDLTRKYYLVGRDQMIRELALSPGERVLEIGCGTARNLVLMAKRYPNAMFYGIDASEEMLRSARALVRSHGLDHRIKLAQGLAGTGDGLRVFGDDRAYDRVVISYALSMFDDPTMALEDATAMVRPGGALHIVDFAQMDGMPGLAAKGLRAWLALFDVTPRAEVRRWLETQATSEAGRLETKDLMGGYAELLRYDKLAALTNAATAVAEERA